MTHKNLIYSLVILMTAIVSILSNITIIAKAEDPTYEVPNVTSCINPQTYKDRAKCREIEQQILSTTVRIQMQGVIMIGGQQLPMTRCCKSHATVLNGRYLVTHNHFGYDLTEEAPADGEGYTGLILRSANGKMLLESVPLSALVIVYEDNETLVLDLLDEKGNSLIESLELPTPQIIDWKAVNWKVGLELAHIDWNGEKAHVDWVLVEEVITNGATPHIQVNNFAKDGASGGGLYWNGIHVGNNWAINWEKDPNTGDVIRRYTIIALNSLDVAMAVQN